MRLINWGCFESRRGGWGVRTGGGGGGFGGGGYEEPET